MENKKTRNEILILFGIVFFFIFYSINFASAFSFVNNPQIFQIGSNTIGATFNPSMCQQNQDFAVQISPTGCQPLPVRSDLLEDQDVPVWCPLAATQLNPLINVKSINSISFSGTYPSTIQSIGFYPAQAGLNLNGQTNGYPTLSNIGYAVIDLKQQPNESAM